MSRRTRRNHHREDGMLLHSQTMRYFKMFWPLQLLDMTDEKQIDVLHNQLLRSPLVVMYYLTDFVFPETCRHQGLKLSASGQELGSSILFKQRLGFSGTPSDLAPRELGRVQYERGSDGKMIHFLTNEDTHSLTHPHHTPTPKQIPPKIVKAVSLSMEKRTRR